jgi:hypothetical protein
MAAATVRLGHALARWRQGFVLDVIAKFFIEISISGIPRPVITGYNLSRERSHLNIRNLPGCFAPDGRILFCALLGL